MIKTGYVTPGHDVEFEQDAESCTVVCECGWPRQLASFPNPWIVLELRTAFNQHLVAAGVR